MANQAKQEVLNLKSVIVGDQNSRTDIGDLSDLMSSMKQHGLLQAPGVNKRADGTYHLIFGFRRYNAAERLGWTSLTFSVFDGASQNEETLLNLLENMQRKNLTVDEIGRQVTLIRELGYKTSEIATRLGIGVATLDNALKNYRRMPQKWRDKVQISTKGHSLEPGMVTMKVASALQQFRRKNGISMDDVAIDEVFKLAATPVFNVKEIKNYYENVKEKRPITAGIQRISRVASPGFISEKESVRLTKTYIDTGNYDSMASIMRAIITGNLKETVEVTTG